MAGQRSAFLDMTKGLLITLVVIGHAVQYVQYQRVDFWRDPLYEAIYLFHMPLFMAVSGYIAFKGMTSEAPFAVLMRRLKGLLIPIWVWATMWHATLTAVRPDLTLSDLPKAFFDTGASILWFLWALVGSLIVLALATKAGRHKYLVLGAMTVLVMFLPDTRNIYLFQYVFPFFVLGYLVADRGLSTVIRKHAARLLPVTAVAAIAFTVFWEPQYYVYTSKMSFESSNLLNISVRWAAGLIVSVFVICTIVLLERRLPSRLKEALVHAGRSSIAIYILSTFALYVFAMAVPKYTLPIQGTIYGDVLSLVIGAVLTYLCWAASRLLMRNDRLALLLFGRRQQA